MHFCSSVIALAAAAVLANAGTVTFWTLDNAKRTIYFTPNRGYSEMKSVRVDKSKKTTVQFAEPWIGNFYGIIDGQPNVPGMLGEVNFGGWNGMNYFDVSAIINGSDHNNVKQMWPQNSKSPMSGCEVFPCDNAYWLPDDVQTKVTRENDLMTSLGSGSTGLF